MSKYAGRVSKRVPKATKQAEHPSRQKGPPYSAGPVGAQVTRGKK